MKAAWTLFFFFLCSGLLWAGESVTIEIEGMEGEPLENVRAVLVLPPGTVEGGKVDILRLDRLQGQIPEKVRSALEPFGYYDAVVRVERRYEDGGIHHLTVKITPGEPVRVKTLRLAIEGPGAQEKTLLKLASDFPLRREDILRHDVYERIKGALIAGAQDLGYLDAAFSTHVIRVTRETQSAEIELVLDTGPRYYFDDVKFVGVHDYPERFLRRYLAFKPGDFFSYEKLGETQLNFRNADRFREIVVTAQKEEAKDRRLPVEVLLDPSPPKRLRPGIGYGTDTGGRIMLRYEDVNVLRTAQELRAELYFSQIRQTAGLKYTLPDFQNLNSGTSLNAGLNKEDVDTYTTRTAFAEIERVRAFGTKGRGSLYLRALYEDYAAGGDDGTSFLVLPGARYSRRDYRGRTARPDEGYHYSLELRGTHQALGSDTGLLQILASGSALFSLPARFSALFRVDSAYTEKDDTLKNIPVSLRFFAGGDRSVRGYAYQSLGPVDETGKVAGGRNLFAGSIEIERALGEDWAVAAFYDAGNSFNALANIRLFQAAGIGARYYTVVGPIKLDLARQIKVDDPAYRFHFTLGFAF